MTVNELIRQLQELADSGAGEAVTTCYALTYYSDDVVTFLVSKAPLLSDYPPDMRPVRINLIEQKAS